jgi:hypothetical protein
MAGIVLANVAPLRNPTNALANSMPGGAHKRAPSRIRSARRKDRHQVRPADKRRSRLRQEEKL